MQSLLVRNAAADPGAKLTEIQVGIADLKIASSPDRVITLGLGSCVGITLYDPAGKIGGLVHIMLPDSNQFSSVTKSAKFADLGIPLLLTEIKRRGGQVNNLQAKMAGGAQMFSGLDKNALLNIGDRNIAMSRQVLKSLGLRILAEEVGGNKGRTMILDTSNGQVTIRTVGQPLKII